jgi:glycosyltransferase involved in cell wall biosynthesis
VRIALFSGNYNYLREGANQALNQLVGYLERRGHEVRVYSPVTDTPAFESKGTLVPVPSIPLPVRSEFRLGLGIPAAIRRDIERFAPDLIHVSTPDILCTRAETLAEKLNIPVVASLHTRFTSYFDYYGIGWLRPLAEAHLQRFYRRASCVLAPTPGLVEEMKHLRGDDHVALWSRGVDREFFKPSRRDPEWRRSHGWNSDDKVLLFFGRPVLEKGIDLYIDTVRILQNQGHQVRPLIVGAGPAADRLRALPGAVLTGHLDGPDLARAVASADIMIHPSLTEAFGNVVLEAMASGLAVVASDAPSSRALIDPGKTGLLCTPNSSADLAEAAARLIDDPAERLSIGNAAREASAAHSWDAASGAAEAAYHLTLQQFAGRAIPVPMTA